MISCWKKLTCSDIFCMIAVVLTNALIRDYLVNYARPLIYTTALSYTNIIAADCAFNLLEDGTAESVRFIVLLSSHVAYGLSARQKAF